MLGWIIAIAAVLGLGFLAWKQYGHLIINPDVELPAPAPEPLPVHERTIDLVLPSVLPALKFSARFKVSYIQKGELRVGEDIEQVLRWELHQAAQHVTSQYPLTVSTYLHLALTDRLQPWRWVRDGAVGLQAVCTEVKANPKDLPLAVDLERTKFTLDMESQLHDASLEGADRLGRLLSEPRTAALWWFARHPDRVEDLPRITELMHSLDAQLNHRGSVLAPGIVSVGGFAPTSGTDLDAFLSDADGEERVLVLNTLAAAYDRLGRPEMAERARALADPVEDDDLTAVL